MPSTTSRTRFSSRSRTSGVRLRAVPRSCAVCGMTLSAVPAWNCRSRPPPIPADRRCARRSTAAALTICAPTSTGVDAEYAAARRAPPRPSMSMIDAVGRRHHRAGPDGEFADRQAGIVVHAVDLLDAEAVHHAVLDHLAAAAAALLGRLEDHHRGAGEVARLGEIFARRRAASRCGRHGRRRASCRALSTCRAGRWPPRSAARPCRRAAR